MKKIIKVERNFYLRNDVVQIARELLGKVLVTRIHGIITKGIISETEAYNGVVDRASHAYGGRRTKRTETMYKQGGTAYIYLCYGIHHLFNVVTNREGIPHAVLVRSLIPFEGIDTMKKRRKTNDVARLCSGPGSLTQAMGITTSYDGTDLTGNLIWLEDHGIKPSVAEISISSRIGVDYAGEDALLPYRFIYHPQDFLRGKK